MNSFIIKDEIFIALNYLFYWFGFYIGRHFAFYGMASRHHCIDYS